MDKMVIGLLAGALVLLGFVPYLRAIRRGETTADRTSWSVWAVLGLLTVASYRLAGAGATVWVAAAAALGPSIVAAYAWRYGEGWLSLFGIACLAAAAIGFVLLVLRDDPVEALTLALAIDFIGGTVPTWRKTWQDPDSEDAVTWLLWLAACVLNLFAVEEWSYALAAYPVYVFLAILGVAGLMFRRRLTSPDWHAPRRPFEAGTPRDVPRSLE